MNGSFIIFLMILAFHGCYCTLIRHKRYPTKRSSVHFTLNGQRFQLQLLNLTGNQELKSDATTTENPTVADEVIAKGGTEAIDQIAQLNVIGRTTDLYPTTLKTVENIQETAKPLKGSNDVYKRLLLDIYSLLKTHEKELLSLDQNQEKPVEQSNNLVKYPGLLKDQLGEETAINIHIHDANNNRTIQSHRYAYNDHFSPEKLKYVDDDNLNIRLRADPPMKMRTIIGYPRKVGSGKIHPLRKDFTGLRIFARETVNPRVIPDTEPKLQDNVNYEDHPSQEEAFLRRGSELLLRIWKRFQERKLQNKPDNQEMQNSYQDYEGGNYNG